MKKILLFLLITTGCLCASSENEGFLESAERKVDKKGFCYASLGAIGLGFWIGFPNVALGYRSLHSHHVYDVNFGVCGLSFKDLAIYYGQFSYLYYNHSNKGFYFGPGLTVICHSHDVKFNLTTWKKFFFFDLHCCPITFGFQFERLKNRHHFIQLQVTPFPSATLSYGIGF